MPEWRIEKQHLEVYDANSKSWAALCEAFGVEKVEADLLTGLQKVSVYVDSVRAGRNSVMKDRSSLQQKLMMTSLMNLGLTVADSDDERAVVQEILLEQDKKAPLQYVHHKLGFATVNNTEVFLLDKVIGDLSPPKANSRFYVDGIVTPTGTLQAWTSFIRSEVQGWLPMELALAAGASAPVAHLLKMQHKVFDLPILAYIGTTSVGKTTALRLSANIWGLPIEGIGLIDNLNTTENAFVESVSSNVGVPSFIDETSAKPTWDFDRMVYFLPSGKGKKRCDKNGNVRPATMFSGAVIFTGERSLMQMTQKQTGMSARIAEFSFDSWARDEAHAERISEACCSNYAVAAPVLVKWLLHHREELPTIFDSERQKLRKKTKLYSGVEARIVKIYATILTAAHALNESLGLSLNLEGLREALIQQLIGGRAERDKIGNVYQSILVQIAEHGAHFAWPSKRYDSHPRERDLWGTFEYYKSTTCVWLSDRRFEEMLGNAGVHSPKEIQRPWVEKGWLVDFGSRHYLKKHNINGVWLRSYCILLPQSPSLFERLAAMPSNADSTALIRALRGGDADAAAMSDQNACDKSLKAAADDEKMAVGIVRPSYQGERVIFNNSFCSALYLKDEAYVLIVPDHNILMISSAPIGKNSTKLKLKSFKEFKLVEHSVFYKMLAKAIGITLERGRGIMITDIGIDRVKGTPVAIVNIGADDPSSIVYGDVTSWEFPKKNDEIDNCSPTNRELLLGNG